MIDVYYAKYWRPNIGKPIVIANLSQIIYYCNLFSEAEDNAGYCYTTLVRTKLLNYSGIVSK